MHLSGCTQTAYEIQKWQSKWLQINVLVIYLLFCTATLQIIKHDSKNETNQNKCFTFGLNKMISRLCSGTLDWRWTEAEGVKWLKVFGIRICNNKKGKHNTKLVSNKCQYLLDFLNQTIDVICECNYPWCSSLWCHHVLSVKIGQKCRMEYFLVSSVCALKTCKAVGILMVNITNALTRMG